MASPNNTTRSTKTEGSRTQTRSSWYSNGNESQAQRAGTSSGSNNNTVVPATTSNSDDDDDRRTMSRRTYSSGDASSNTNTSTYTTTGPGPGPAPVWPAAPAATLTESTLGTHQMQTARLDPVYGWLAQPGPCDRLVRRLVPSRPSSSIAAVGDVNSRQSTAGSSISLEYEPAPPPRTMTNDIREVGAWCRRLERRK